MECVDRSEVSRSLAKAIAYQNAGKPAEAEKWARTLVQQLKQAQILNQNGGTIADTRDKCECKCGCQKPRCGDGGRGTPVQTWSACFDCGAEFLGGSRKHRAATR